MAQQLAHVRPGDLITARTFNVLIDVLNGALLRIEALEAGTAPSTGLAITQMIPISGPYRIGDDLEILGSNFQFGIGATRVFFNATQVFNLLPTSTDSRLQFVIPSVPGVVDGGTDVELAVMNQNETVTRSIRLFPRQNPLQGSVVVEYLSVDPQQIAAGQPATFRYRIESRTNNLATWTINPQIEVAANADAWNAQMRVLNGQSAELPARQLTLNPGGSEEFFVHILTVPAGSDGVDFGVTVNAGSANIGGSSGARQFTVGQQAETPDTTITLSAVPAFSQGALDGNTLTVSNEQPRVLAINAELTKAGEYQVFRQVLSGAGWTVNPSGGALDSFTITDSDLSGDGTASRVLRYSVFPSGIARSAAQLRITVQRQGESLSQSIIVNLKKGTQS